MASYVSAKIHNELMTLLGHPVQETIVADIKAAQHFGMLFDSTPDVSHTEQMSEVIRHVHIEGDKTEVRESFLGFISIAGKTAADLIEDILNRLRSDGQDINMCRSQGYDNAANMDGTHGVHKKIRDQSKSFACAMCKSFPKFL